MEKDNLIPDLREKTVDLKKALESKDYRQASRIYADFRKLFSLAAQQGEPSLKGHFEGQVHLVEARRNHALYQAEREERGSPSALEESATNVIREAKQAIQYFPDKDSSESQQSYQMLFTGYECLLQCRVARIDVSGGLEAIKQLEESITEYRRVAPQEQVKPYIFKLHVTRILLGLAQAMQAMLEMNLAGVQNNAKVAKESLQRAKNETDEKETLDTLQNFENIIQGISDFAQGALFQERGGYSDAAQYFTKAVALESSTEANLQAYGKLAKALHHYCLALAGDFDGRYDAAIKEYSNASHAFSEAADAFPADSPGLLALGNRSRFYADAAQYRLDATKHRYERRRQGLQRSKRIAGLVFFGLWLLGLGTSTILITNLQISLNAFTFLALLLVNFVAAALAAALISPKEALDFLKELIAAFRKDGSKELPKD